MTEKEAYKQAKKSCKDWTEDYESEEIIFAYRTGFMECFKWITRQANDSQPDIRPVCTHCYGTGKDHGDESMQTDCPSCK